VETPGELCEITHVHIQGERRRLRERERVRGCDKREKGREERN